MAADRRAFASLHREADRSSRLTITALRDTPITTAHIALIVAPGDAAGPGARRATAAQSLVSWRAADGQRRCRLGGWPGLQFVARHAVQCRSANPLHALQAWKDGDPNDPGLMDRVEAILRGQAPDCR